MAHLHIEMKSMFSIQFEEYKQEYGISFYTNKSHMRTFVNKEYT